MPRPQIAHLSPLSQLKGAFELIIQFIYGFQAELEYQLIQSAHQLRAGWLGALDDRFRIDPRTLHTNFTATSEEIVDIQLLSFPGTFKRSLSTRQFLQISSGVRCLTLATLLDSKCASMPKRTSQVKRDSNGTNTVFILQLLVSRRQRLRPSEVPSAKSEFQEYSSQFNDGSTALFRQVGLKGKGMRHQMVDCSRIHEDSSGRCR